MQMKNKKRAIKFGALLLMVLSLLSASSAYATEEAKPVFDTRHWELGWSINKRASGNGHVFKEYVLKGETVKNWSELVTVQFFPGLNKKSNLETFEASVKQAIMKACHNTKWTTFEQKQDARSWEFTIKNCDGQPDQSELARAVATNDGVHVFHYVIKKAPMPKHLKETWAKNLKAIKVNKK